MDADGKELKRSAVRQLELGARILPRAEAQSATADLAGEAEIRTEHLAEAL
jgi:predicted ATPase with chaperone activity